MADGANHWRGRGSRGPLMNLPRDERLLGWSKEEELQQERRHRRRSLCVCVCLPLQQRGCVGGNKLSHCREVCSSKAHLPICTRAMPEGCRVRGQEVPLQSTQITYPLQSINWLLSLLPTLTIQFLYPTDSNVKQHHTGLQYIWLSDKVI